MTQERNIRLILTKPEFLVIHSFLMSVRLGSRNHFEEAISELTAEIDTVSVFNFVNACGDEFGIPKFMVEASDEDGLVFNVS